MAIAPGKIAVRDYEYVRNGTANIFVAVEPKGGKHYTEVTERRTKQDYAKFEESLIATFEKRKMINMMKRIKPAMSQKTYPID